MAVFTENELFMDFSKSADKITLFQPNATDHQSCILKPDDAPRNNLAAITRAISITATAHWKENGLRRNGCCWLYGHKQELSVGSEDSSAAENALICIGRKQGFFLNGWRAWSIVPCSFLDEQVTGGVTLFMPSLDIQNALNGSCVWSPILAQRAFPINPALRRNGNVLYLTNINLLMVRSASSYIYVYECPFIMINGSLNKNEQFIAFPQILPRVVDHSHFRPTLKANS